MATEHNDGTPRTILVPDRRERCRFGGARPRVVLADGTDAIVHVLAVVDVTADPMRFDAALVSDLERAKERLVDEVVATAADHDADVTGASVADGPPNDRRLRRRAGYRTDRSRTVRAVRIAAPLLGSTADRVVRTASTPVLIVPEATADAEA